MERYQPQQPAGVESLEALLAFVLEENRRIAIALEGVLPAKLDVLHKVPSKPREGQVVYADGTNWNPGSGAGPYSYVGGVWTRMLSNPPAFDIPPTTISPAQLVANTNNWNPTGLLGATAIRFSTDTSRNITGLSGGVEGDIKVLSNIGSFPAVFKSEDANSTAANRFAVDQDVVVYGGQTVAFHYDGTSSRWRLLFAPYRVDTPIAVGRNIAARTNATTPNSKIDISADHLLLADASGSTMRVSNVAVTVDIAVAGVNGLDTGIEAANTWYYGWVIAKPDGTIAGLLSISSSAPTIPAGYTYKALVPAVRNDGSSNFLKFRQFGNKVRYEGYKQVVAAGTATTETTVSCSSFVPPIAQFIEAHLRIWLGQDGSAVADIALIIRIVSGVDYTAAVIGHTANGAGASFNAAWSANDVLIPNLSQQFIYLLNSATGNRSADIFLVGFDLPGGGE